MSFKMMQQVQVTQRKRQYSSSSGARAFRSGQLTPEAKSGTRFDFRQPVRIPDRINRS